ncbi:NAD(P)/FAD-dependent oxidoreductase [Celeribacter indicus]|uniref:Pyridine nucleotide-disulfide oxidoreductase n=1 Tax=Celeribacter indicus TaxID=1208324 RepID=A0A0B5DPG7_9RHOB|nr:FAD-dependent oxidoreductase [Celeribacter indicus]AJE45069.1 pyridine nucleotide-disulfide oxidoreductase [Celeribacter indicus]SDX42556.1 3-phenylpropionate/trans-cinnamate dioxygenase ferredoxin reductase subunit [Celeribacter indicus]
MEHFVILGGGQAAATAARTLRDEGFGGSVTIVSEENRLPYERPPLSKAVLQGEADVAKVTLIPEEALVDLNLDLLRGHRAVALDRGGRKVILSSGRELSYDRLLIATGSRPRLIDGPLSGKSNVFYLRTFDDAERLRAAMAPGKTLLSVGAGWIGLEVAATARKLGLQAAVVEMAGRLCARCLPAEVGSALERIHRDHGTKIHLDTRITEVAGRDAVEAVTLSSGEVLPVDIVVIGIGAVPNVELARDAGLEIGNGVVVDPFLRTSDPHIFAAGDVAAMRDETGRSIRMESWANAQDQAAAAARNMMGENSAYSVNTWFWSDQYDLNLQMIGDCASDGGEVFLRQGEGGAFTRLCVAGGKLVGAICFDAPRDMAIVRRLLARGYSPAGDELQTAPDLRKLL